MAAASRQADAVMAVLGNSGVDGGDGVTEELYYHPAAGAADYRPRRRENKGRCASRWEPGISQLAAVRNASTSAANSA